MYISSFYQQPSVLVQNFHNIKPMAMTIGEKVLEISNVSLGVLGHIFQTLPTQTAQRIFFQLNLAGFSLTTLFCLGTPFVVIKRYTGKVLPQNFSITATLMSYVGKISQDSERSGFKKHVLSRILCVAAGALAALDAYLHATGAVLKLGVYTVKITILTTMKIVGAIFLGIDIFLLSSLLGSGWVQQAIKVLALCTLLFRHPKVAFDSLRSICNLWVRSVVGAVQVGAITKEIEEFFKEYSLQAVAKHMMSSFKFAVNIIYTPALGLVNPKACARRYVKLGVEKPEPTMWKWSVKMIRKNPGKILIAVGLIAGWQFFPESSKTALSGFKDAIGDFFTSDRAFMRQLSKQFLDLEVKNQKILQESQQAAQNHQAEMVKLNEIINKQLTSIALLENILIRSLEK